MKASTILFAAVLAAGGTSHLAAQQTDAATSSANIRTRHAIEVSPMSPMFHIYAVQYAYHLDDANVLMAGISYADIAQKPADKEQPTWMDIVITPNTLKKDIGQNHSWALIVGYKRYIWKGFHLEYQLWPGYNAFRSNTEQKYYRGFDLWNEFRAGYTIDFGDSPLYMNIQYLVGFGLVRGNKPSDFNEGGDPVFHAPLLFVGYRF
jgi:hypothetical protein